MTTGPGDPEGNAGGVLERPEHPLGSTFVLAGGGLRRLRGTGRAFLGYTGGEMFWRDALELVHREDLGYAEDLVHAARQSPGSVQNGWLRLRAADGGWRVVEASVRNVVEAPGDVGLVFADFEEVATNGQGRPRHY